MTSEWKKNNKDKVREQKRRWRQKNSSRIKETRKRYKLKKKYGISFEIYQQLLLKQNNLCAICGKHAGQNSWEHGTLSVDHDHSTGRVRGLLCGGCNYGLGCFKESPERLAGAIRYLATYALG